MAGSNNVHPIDEKLVISIEAGEQCGLGTNPMSEKNEIIPVEFIEEIILLIREHRVIIDRDLAALYGVRTKAFNQAVKRNEKKFPEDFRFQLNKDEKNELVTNCDRFKTLKHSSSMPYAFTEHGALMAANILNSERASAMSVYVIRAFVKLRQMIIGNHELSKKLGEMERRLDNHEEHLAGLLKAIDYLLAEPEPKKKGRIGFIPED